MCTLATGLYGTSIIIINDNLSGRVEAAAPELFDVRRHGEVLVHDHAEITEADMAKFWSIIMPRLQRTTWRSPGP